MYVKFRVGATKWISTLFILSDRLTKFMKLSHFTAWLRKTLRLRHPLGPIKSLAYILLGSFLVWSTTSNKQTTRLFFLNTLCFETTHRHNLVCLLYLNSQSTEKKYLTPWADNINKFYWSKVPSGKFTGELYTQQPVASGKQSKKCQKWKRCDFRVDLWVCYYMGKQKAGMFIRPALWTWSGWGQPSVN